MCTVHGKKSNIAAQTVKKGQKRAHKKKKIENARLRLRFFFFFLRMNSKSTIHVLCERQILLYRDKFYCLYTV